MSSRSSHHLFKKILQLTASHKLYTKN
uniref:Uncharacterized protein n=1 Tax=Anguilla anguilla TaxID=7936 RepID=A0A0E9U2A8_ANGAN